MFQSHLPLPFWSFSVCHAVHLLNLLPTINLNNHSPHYILHNTSPDLTVLRVFGSLCFASTLQAHRTKVQPRAKKCIFLGHSFGTKGFILFDLQTREIFASRHVVFYETIFPYQKNSPPPSSTDPLFKIPLPAIDTLTSTVETTSFPSADTGSVSNGMSAAETSVTSPQFDHSALSSSPIPINPPIRASTRVRQPPKYLGDYKCNDLNSLSSANCSSGMQYPLSDFTSFKHTSSTHTAFLLSLSTISEPQTYNQAVQHSCWRDAMDKEVSALESNKTWILTELPPNKKAIDAKWVYKIKRKSDGSIERFKARLVAKGYTQLEGVDYSETFSPVVKLTTVRLILALAIFTQLIFLTTMFLLFIELVS